MSERRKPGPKTSATLNPDWWREYRKKWKAARIAAGTCLYCPDKAQDQRPTCRECREIAKFKQANRRQNRIAA